MGASSKGVNVMLEPYQEFEIKDAEEQKEIEKYPVCIECGEHILDDYAYQLDDGLICEDCLKSYHRVSLED